MFGKPTDTSDAMGMMKEPTIPKPGLLKKKKPFGTPGTSIPQAQTAPPNLFKRLTGK